MSTEILMMKGLCLFPISNAGNDGTSRLYSDIIIFMIIIPPWFLSFLGKNAIGFKHNGIKSMWPSIIWSSKVSLAQECCGICLGWLSATKIGHFVGGIVNLDEGQDHSMLIVWRRFHQKLRLWNVTAEYSCGLDQIVRMEVLVINGDCGWNRYRPLQSWNRPALDLSFQSRWFIRESSK